MNAWRAWCVVLNCIGFSITDLHVQIVVYTISSDSHSQSFILHGADALTSYQDDEADVRKTQPGSAPLIANHGVRRRLLAAKTAPPGDLDLENVAMVVEHPLGSRSETADVVVRSWYCLVSYIFVPCIA